MKIGHTFARPAGVSRQIDLSRLPAEHRETGFRGAGVFMIIFSLFWGGMPTFGLISSLLKGEMQPGLWFLLIFTIIGTGLLIFGLKMVTTRRTIRFSATQVDFDERSLFGQRIWSEPLKNFPGVRTWSEYHSGGKNRSSYTLYIAELFHPEPRKRLRLYESRSEEGLRGIQEGYCRQLNVPALEGEPGNFVARNVEDLDKSVRELASEGKLKIAFDPAKPPPAGVTLSVIEEKRLRIELPRTPVAVGGVVMAVVISSIFIGISVGVKSAPAMIGVFGAIFLLVVVAGLVWQIVARPVVVAGADSIEVRHRTPWGETRGRTIESARIESVRIGQRTANQGPAGLMLVTDQRTEIIGAGMPAAVLEWLRDCILAVVARGA